MNVDSGLQCHIESQLVKHASWEPIGDSYLQNPITAVPKTAYQFKAQQLHKAVLFANKEPFLKSNKLQNKEHPHMYTLYTYFSIYKITGKKKRPA